VGGLAARGVDVDARAGLDPMAGNARGNCAQGEEAARGKEVSRARPATGSATHEAVELREGLGRRQGTAGDASIGAQGGGEVTKGGPGEGQRVAQGDGSLPQRAAGVPRRAAGSPDAGAPRVVDAVQGGGGIGTEWGPQGAGSERQMEDAIQEVGRRASGVAARHVGTGGGGGRDEGPPIFPGCTFSVSVRGVA